jgi:hypothetical protein
VTPSALFEERIVMAITARIIGISLITGALGAGLGISLFGQYSDYMIPTLLLACVGGGIGAVAGAVRELLTDRRQRLSS